MTIIRPANSTKVTTFARAVTDVKHAGDNIDTLHQAGSPHDYWLMGTTYKAIAPRGWVRMPATTPATAGTVKQVCVGSDGSLTLTTGVTMRSPLVNDFVANIPAYISTKSARPR